MGVYIKARFNYDPDALAFIQASSIPNTTQKLAINQLVLDLKAYGLWSKMKAIYPMVGGSAFYHKWNLKDPRDLDAAFRLVFSGGWTHSATGAQPGGVNGYANTFLNPNSAFSVNDNIHFSYYSRTNANDTDCEIGVQVTNYLVLSIKRTTISNQTYYGLNTTSTFSTFVDSNSAAFYIGSRIGTAQKGFRNSSLVANTINTAGARPNGNVFLATLNVNGNPDAGLYSAKECAFASLGDGLTDTEAANFYTAVQNFQIALGRSIGPQIVSDPDAQAFVTAANIEDQVQAQAVNQLVIDMKAANIWTKMKAIYPFVGGTAASHKWNLKNPLDTNAAFRLVFNGGWTHSSTGALPNGTNAYADTNLNMSTNYSVNTSVHISYYSRTSGAFTSQDMGAYNGTTFTALPIQRATAPNQSLFAANETINYITANDTNGAAFYIANRTALNIMNGWRNNTKVATGTSTAGTRPNLNMFLAAQNYNGTPNSGLYGKRECAFASIGDGLTDTEAANFYTMVQTFNTTLNRQV